MDPSSHCICLEYGMTRSSNITENITITLVSMIVTKSAEPDSRWREWDVWVLLIIEVESSDEELREIFFFGNSSSDKHLTRILSLKTHMNHRGECEFPRSWHLGWYLEWSRQKLCFTDMHIWCADIDPYESISSISYIIFTLYDIARVFRSTKKWMRNPCIYDTIRFLIIGLIDPVTAHQSSHLDLSETSLCIHCRITFFDVFWESRILDQDMSEKNTFIRTIWELFYQVEFVKSASIESIIIKRKNRWQSHRSRKSCQWSIVEAELSILTKSKMFSQYCLGKSRCIRIDSCSILWETGILIYSTISTTIIYDRPTSQITISIFGFLCIRPSFRSHGFFISESTAVEILFIVIGTSIAYDMWELGIEIKKTFLNIDTTREPNLTPHDSLKRWIRRSQKCSRYQDRYQDFYESKTLHIMEPIDHFLSDKKALVWV